MIRSLRFACILGVSLLSLALSGSASAQVAGGTISGTVTDPGGAAIPATQVTIRSVETSVERTINTNDAGYYSAPNLTPGPYQVTFAASGFATTVRENLDLTVGAELVVNAQLKIGQASEKVEIKAELPTIESGTSTLSGTVEEKTIKDLPLNGRDWTQLATLEPGVVSIATEKPIQNGANARVNSGWGLQMTISGNRPQQTNYRLDGVSLNDYASNGPGSVLGGSAGVDSVREFSVVTSNASADYGKTSGGVLNAVTISGTNQFHGTAYEFLRNSALDARNFFDGPQVPPFKRNQFGASIGGPIYLPRFGEGGRALGYKGQNRTFFFFDYEAVRQSLSTTATDVVPSRAARAGQLASGKVTINSKVLPFLNLFPLSNGTETGDTGTFAFVGKTITDQNFYTARVDHKISDKDSIYGTFLNDVSQITGPDSFNFSLSGLISRRHLFTFGENHIISPSVANFFRLGFYRVVADGPKPLTAIDPRAADPSFGFLPGNPIGVLTITGLSVFSGGLGAQAESIFHFNSLQAYDDLYYTKGNHSLKFGFAIENARTNEFQTNQPIGAYNFGSLRNFLLNQVQLFSSPLPGAQPEIGLRQTILGAYVQDDWRFRPNLTLNLGLRYEIATVPKEEHDRLSSLVQITDATPKVGNPYFNNPTLKNFSPRLGFSWDPFKDGKTAIRGGIGLYDTLPLAYQMTGFVTAVSPFAQLGNVSNPPVGTFPDGGLRLLTPNNVRVAYVEQNPKRMYVTQWNLNIQREVMNGLMVQVGYVGSHGVHQPFRSNDADIVLPIQTLPGAYIWPKAGTGTRLNPNVGRIEALAWLVSTSYNALNVRVVKRMSHGFQAQASYTWSKSLDNGSASVAGGTFDNSIVGPPLALPNVLRGLSDFDIRHIFVFNYLWNIPGPHSAHGLVGTLAQGWQLGGIFRASSGQPFTTVIGGDPLGLGNSSPFDFPDRVNSPNCANPVNPGNPSHYIKTECFVAPPINRLGNAGRNSVIGPGLQTFDTSLIKDTRISKISENFHVQFRTEFFNLFNRSNFETPTSPANQLYNASLTPLTAAGSLFRTTTTSRQIQFALKLIW